MSLLFLNAHETRLIRDGRVYDPKYRPWPGSPFEDVDPLDGDFGVPGVSFWDFLDSDPDAEVDFEAVDPERPTAPVTGPIESNGRRGSTVPVNVAGRYWQRSTRRVVFIVGRFADGQSVIGVGNCRTIARRAAQGSATVELTAWCLFARRIPLATLLAELPPRNRHVLTRIVEDEEARPLPPATEEAFRSAMRTLEHGLDNALGQLPDFSSRRAPVPTRDLPAWDTQQSALRLFTAQWRTLEPVADPDGPTPFALALETQLIDPPEPERLSGLAPIAKRSEHEAITDDTGAFLDWASEGRSHNGWFEFRSDDRQLLVKNINFTKSSRTLPAPTWSMSDLSRSQSC